MRTGGGYPGVLVIAEKPHYVKLLIFSEFIENSTKFMKNSGLTASKSLNGYASHKDVVFHKSYNPAKNITEKLRTLENSWEHLKTTENIGK